MTPNWQTWQTVCSNHFLLGESPFWHPFEHMLYWVDIAGKKVVRANIYMGTVEQWDMPTEPGCIAPAATGGLVIAMRHGVFRAKTWGGALELVARLPYDTSFVRANDGKCDALGRFWVGTVDEQKTQRAAELFSIDARGARAPEIQRHAGNALTGNGLAWSVDSRTVYWADTSSHIVHAWDFDLQGNALRNPRTFLEFPAKSTDQAANQAADQPVYGGRPDGAAVDALGNYWVAMYEGQRLCQFAPDGTLKAQYPTPAMCPTMPCFGGEDFKTIYLTSARKGRSPEELASFPESGGVFAMRVDVPGLPVNSFVD